jgi:hypothetical protein
MITKYLLITAAGALAIGAALVLSGCSSHASTSSAAATPGGEQPAAQGQGQGQGQGGGLAGGAGTGTSGKIAAISGNTLQVQSSSDQTAVKFGSSTKITQTVNVSLSAVKVGECVTANAFPTAAASSSSSSSSSTSSPAASTVVTNVSISQPTAGSCTNAFGARGGAGGTRPSNRPSFSASNRPSSGRTFGGQFSAPTSGKVTAVSGSSITIDALDFQTRKTSPKTVTVTSATKYTETKAATSSALTVGKCVLARGSADDSGSVTATSIAVSSPVNGSCTAGFAGRGGFRGGQGGNGNTGQSGTTNG